MENYYDILEVSPKASKQIIDKVYKTLAKKYHPDTNPEDKKEWAAEKFKKINEAYEVISDKEKRAEYDKMLEAEKEQQGIENQNLKQKLQEMYEQNQILRQRLESITPHNYSNNTYNTNTNETQYTNMQEEINKQVTQSVNKAYHDAYIQRMKSYGYKIHYKKTFKERLKDFASILLCIAVILFIFFILWQIPSVRNYIESNKIFKAFIDAFLR